MSSPAPPLPVRVKAGYGSAELGLTGIEVVIQIVLLKLYTEVVGLNANLAGLTLAGAVVWDAVVDPVVGAISDRTRTTRQGKRRPFIAFGTPALSLAFLLLLSPPVLASQLGKAVFLFVAYALVNTTIALATVPHSALAGELSGDPVERTELFAWRFMFSNLGLVSAAVILAVVDPDADPGARMAYSPVALALGAVAVATAVVTLWATRGRDVPSMEPPASLGVLARGLLSVLRTRPFLPLFAAFVIASIGRTVNASVALFY